MKIAVVGAGIMGSATALELARAGADVTVFEQFPLGHNRGSSHGRSRIVRRAYPDAFYTRIMVEAYPIWREWEELFGEKLVDECGLIYRGPEHSPEVVAMQKGLSDSGVVFEQVTVTAGLRPSDIGILTREAGWVRADRALHLAQVASQQFGARIVEAHVDLPELKINFDRTIITAGGWVSKMLDLPVRVTAQTFAYFRGRRDGPVWIEQGEDGIYGFPSEPGRDDFKVGFHAPVNLHDPDQIPAPDSAQIERIIESLRGDQIMCDPEPLSISTCLYTSTVSEDFILDWIDEKTIVASPCSGHGFKFGPWVGRTLARAALDQAPLPFPERFSIEAHLRALTNGRSNTQ